jgi:hypothetical protein
MPIFLKYVFHSTYLYRNTLLPSSTSNRGIYRCLFSFYKLFFANRSSVNCWGGTSESVSVLQVCGSPTNNEVNAGIDLMPRREGRDQDPSRLGWQAPPRSSRSPSEHRSHVLLRRVVVGPAQQGKTEQVGSVPPQHFIPRHSEYAKLPPVAMRAARSRPLERHISDRKSSHFFSLDKCLIVFCMIWNVHKPCHASKNTSSTAFSWSVNIVLGFFSLCACEKVSNTYLNDSYVLEYRRAAPKILFF